MRMSDKGMIALIRREALVLTAYKDSVGVWTIGVGHTAAAGAPRPTAGMKISVEDAVALFHKDLAKYEREASDAVKVPLAQHEFDALVSFHYNTGGIAKAALTKKLNAGDREGAAAGFMGWVTPASITGRRNEERIQFTTGDYGAVARVPIYDVYPRGRRMVAAATVLGKSPPTVAEPAQPVKRDVASAVENEAPARSAPITDPHQVSLVQGWLRNLGYTEVGAPDGKIGPYTKAAISAYRSAKGLPPGDGIDDELILTLAKDKEPRQVAPERANATSADVRAAVPEVRANFCTKVWAGVGALGSGAVALGQGVLGNISAAKDYIAPVQDMASDIPPWVWAAAVCGVAAYIWHVARKGEAAGVEAVQTGARR